MHHIYFFLSQLYSERQLLLRGRLGLAPYHPPPIVASVPSKVDAIVASSTSSNIISSTPAVAFIPPLAISYPTAPTPIPAPLPHLIMPPARPAFIAPVTVVAPPTLISQPPPPYRAPVNVLTSELYSIPTAPVPAPPMYPHISVPPSSYIQPPTWPGIPAAMSNTSGMPSINMMGLGRGWDPHGTMPPQHPHGAYGFSGPGGMMATYGMQGGMPMGLIPMDGQGPGFDSARIDMTGYQDHMYRGEESFSGNGVDSWGNEQNRRQRRQESGFQSSADDKLSIIPKEVESRGDKETKTRSGSRDRMSGAAWIDPEARDRLDRSKDDIERERERGRTDDGMRGEKRRRDDGDDRRDISSRSGRERERESDRNSRGGDLDKRRR